MYKSALADYDKAISLDKSNADLYLNRGYVKVSLKNITGSCKDFQQSAALGSTLAATELANCK